jgi:tellurite resistance protein
VFFALFLATMLPQLARLRFGMPWWAYSFPLAALATATQAAASAIGGSPLQVLSWLTLWLATVVIAGLSTLTARSLARGTLLVAEAGPGRPPERAKADVAADPAR